MTKLMPDSSSAHVKTSRALFELVNLPEKLIFFDQGGKLNKYSIISVEKPENSKFYFSPSIL